MHEHWGDDHGEHGQHANHHPEIEADEKKEEKKEEAPQPVVQKEDDNKLASLSNVLILAQDSAEV